MSSAGGEQNNKTGERLRFLGVLLLDTLLLYLISALTVLAHVNQRFSPIYPVAGVSLALLWLHGLRFWPTVLVSSFALSLQLGSPPITAACTALLDLLVAVATVYLLERQQVDTSLARMRDLMSFGLAITLGSVVSVPLYTAEVGFANAMPLGQALGFGLHYFLATLFGFLLLAPLFAAGTSRSQNGHPINWAVGTSLAAIALIGWLILAVAPELRERLLFLVLPFVVVCATAGRMRGASLAAALVGMVMVAMEANTPASVVEVSLRGLFVATLTVTGYLLAVTFNERERSAAELLYRARHDTLTGLINRYEFENRLRQAIADSSQKYALLYLDLDQFKLVNDTCGHLAGDDMLRKLAERLAGVVPRSAVLARLGGDEFGCLLKHSSLADAEEVAKRVHEAIRTFRYDVGEMSFTVGASIGATFISPEEDRSPDDVLGRADLACYTAKDEGRNRTYVYTPSDRTMSQRHADIHALSQLPSALAGGLFELYAQRIVNIRDPDDQRPFYEVLLRYTDPDDERTATDILESAQRYGVIAQVDRWVFEQSARFLQRNAGKRIRLSLNVTSTTLESDGFEQFVLALPRQYQIDAHQVCIEITEVVAAQNLTGAVGVLQRFREQGFDIALDDFGAGVASFGYLSELPVTMVKIDGHFVRDLGKDPAAEVIIESLARVSALRGITCTAEWVEDVATIPRLRELGVMYAQGFTIHKPAPLVSLEER